jgi:hypothetical protein
MGRSVAHRLHRASALAAVRAPDEVMSPPGDHVVHDDGAAAVARLGIEVVVGRAPEHRAGRVDPLPFALVLRGRSGKRVARACRGRLGHQKNENSSGRSCGRTAIYREWEVEDTRKVQGARDFTEHSAEHSRPAAYRRCRRNLAALVDVRATMRPPAARRRAAWAERYARRARTRLRCRCATGISGRGCCRQDAARDR